MCGTVRKKLKFANSSLPSNDEDTCKPVYENPPVKYIAERIQILLQPDETRVCYVKPSAVTWSTSYVVDVHNLQNQDDIKKDEFGTCSYSGLDPQAYKVYHKKDATWQLKNVVKVHVEIMWYFFAAFTVRIPPTQISSDSFVFFLSGKVWVCMCWRGGAALSCTLLINELGILRFLFHHDTLSWMGYPLQQNPVSSFTLCFITSNINTCIGCKNKYPNTKNGGNSCLLVQQHLKVSLGMLTTTTSFSVYDCCMIPYKFKGTAMPTNGILAQLAVPVYT